MLVVISRLLSQRSNQVTRRDKILITGLKSEPSLAVTMDTCYISHTVVSDLLERHYLKPIENDLSQLRNL